MLFMKSFSLSIPWRCASCKSISFSISPSKYLFLPFSVFRKASSSYGAFLNSYLMSSIVILYLFICATTLFSALLLPDEHPAKKRENSKIPKNTFFIKPPKFCEAKFDPEPPWFFPSGGEGPLTNLYLAPIENSTTGIVFNKILKSRPSDHLSIYSRSILIHFSKSTLFLPLVCHRHVSPGFMLIRLLCHTSYFSTSEGNGGLGPTMDISPFRTLNNCGSSSMLDLLKKVPNLVTLGSFFILNTGPFISFNPFRLSFMPSAPSTIVLNLYITNFLPFTPLLTCLNTAGPGENNFMNITIAVKTGANSMIPAIEAIISNILFNNNCHSSP